MHTFDHQLIYWSNYTFIISTSVSKIIPFIHHTIEIITYCLSKSIPLFLSLWSSIDRMNCPSTDISAVLGLLTSRCWSIARWKQFWVSHHNCLLYYWMNFYHLLVDWKNVLSSWNLFYNFTVWISKW